MRLLGRRACAGAAVLALAAPAWVAGLGGTAGASTASDLGEVTKRVMATRVHLNADGTETVADKRDVTLTVTQTKGLRSRQPVVVSWTGAHPTSGLVADPHAPEAGGQEYPFVLLECRGVDSPSAAPAARMRPETCWTGTSRERTLTDTATGFGPWRVDRYESAANRKKSVGVPDPLPETCSQTFAKGERWLHFVSVAGVDYGTNGDDCLPAPPESQVVTSQSQPANTTYAVTDADGSGSTKFTVWTSEDNASLGCDDKHPCALVAVPIVGISCDTAAAALPAEDRAPSGKTATAVDSACRAENAFAVGAPRIGGTPNRAVLGSLWFSESNWRNRITVPLDFAPLNSVCDVVGARQGVDLYGSELASQMLAQWRPAFCLDSRRTPFKHVQVGEPQAANLLKADNVDAALVTDAPDGGYGRPVVHAPLAVSGFSISYTVDGLDKRPYTKLRLTPRLLAKLMTESYPATPQVVDEYPALARNPLNITLDPEFIALNPGIKQGINDSAAASTLLNLSSDSDVERALTSYLAADPETADWLGGVPDPWGMVVNPNYSTNPRKKSPFKLPVNNWPLRDPFEPKKFYAQSPDVCLREDPVPYLPLIAAPVSRLATTALNLQFANSTSQLVCQSFADLGGKGAKMVAIGRQTPGFRFVLGVTSLGDARRYALDSAALQTYVTPDAAEDLSSLKGRSFVAPDDAGLRAATALLTLDDTAGVYQLPYSKVLSETGKGAYPGAMVLSLAAPTTGLDRTTASAVGSLMDFAVTTGARPGTGIGEMAAGYLPLTDANGAGALRLANSKAAAAVRAQKGTTLAAVDQSGTPPTPAPIPSTGGTAVDTPSLGGVSAPTSSGQTPAAPQPVTAPGPTPHSTPVPIVAVGSTQAVGGGLGGALFPLLLLAGLLGLWSALVIDRQARRGARS